MTDRPSELTPPSEPREIDMVAALAILLLVVALAVVAWLVLWPAPNAAPRGKPASVSVALPPAALIALPPAAPTAPADSATAPVATPDLAQVQPPTATPPASTADTAQPSSETKTPEIRIPPPTVPEAAIVPPPEPAAPIGEPQMAAIPPVPQISPPASEPPSAAPLLVLPMAPAQPPAESTATTPSPIVPNPAQADGSEQAAAAPGAIPSPPNYQPAQPANPTSSADGLTPAPDPALVEQSRDGPLPIIGKDGRKPWQAYARPFDSRDTRPRVSLIISNLGQSAAATEAAIQKLPGAVTLAFVPYAKNLDQWMAQSRASGHETLLAVPMEPISSETEPGPHTLLTSLSERDNKARLLFLLSRASGYVGVLNSMGGRMTTSPQSLRPILSEIKDRGLIFVDARSSQRSIAASQATEIGLPRAINNGFIDLKAARADIDTQLEGLAQLARDSGFALGIASSYPVTIERVAIWAETLNDKGIVLAPITALVDKQPD